MPFKKKTDKEIPKIDAATEKKEWLKEYFTWENAAGELHATEASKLYAEYAEKKAARETSDDTVTLSKKELADLIEGVVEKKIAAKGTVEKGGDMERLVTELVEQLNPDAARGHQKYEEQIDRDDYLDEPVMFFTYMHRFGIFGEKRYGQDVKTPYNRPFIFSNISAHVTGGVGRNGKQVLQISGCQVQTKKEVAWLKKSPKFNTVFFENIKDATVVDRHKALKMNEALNEISGLTEYQIMQRAIGAGVPASKDIEQMKTGLIVKIVEEQMAAEKNISSTAVEAEVLSREARPQGGVRVMSY